MSSENELSISAEESRILFPKKNILNSDQLFDDIIGYNDIKRLFNMSLSSEKPVHILLVGSTAFAKTLFMSECMKLEHSYFTIGSYSTNVGGGLIVFKQLLYDYSNSCSLLFPFILLYSTKAHELITFEVSCR